VPTEKVFLLAEDFRAALDGGLPPAWVAAGSTCASEVHASIKAAGDKEGAPHGQALLLRPRKRFAVLSRQLPQLPAVPSRLHLRARFYDDGAEEGHHWLAIESRLGAGAVGVAPSSRGCYCTSNAVMDLDDPAACQWKPTAVRRSVGWHLFELELQEPTLSVSVDREPVKSLPLQGPRPCESLLLGAAAGACARWGDVELLHTAPGYGTWEVGVLDVRPGNRRPWRVQEMEEGRWRISEDGAVVKLPDEPSPVEEAKQDNIAPAAQQDNIAPAAVSVGEGGAEEEVPADLPVEAPAETPHELPPDPVPEGPPEPEQQQASSDEPEGPADSSAARAPARPKRRAAAKRKPSTPGQRARRSGQQASPRAAGVTVECWSIPGEADMERMDRIMTLFLEKLAEASIVVPSNFTRVGACEEPQHPRCYVYSFGTRRLHLAVREGDGGRLTLVVRCGGGFLDFVEFARRHGGVEQLKLQRRTDPQGGQTVQLVSVLAGRSVNVHERPASRLG